MASVMKMFNNFKSSHLHGGKRSSAHATTITVKDTSPKEDLPEGCPNSDLMNRRRVSVSKSGRYRENHKRRSALPDDTRTSDTDAPASPKHPDTQDVLLRDKDEKNKENEKNKMNAARRESAISVTDGHAVADEIESLAKTIENGTKADLALT